MKKKMALLVLAGFMMFSLTACQPTANEPCERCGDSPSIVYMFDTGDVSYVCKDCGSKCDFCGADAEVPYLNALKRTMFACEECFSKVPKK